MRASRFGQISFGCSRLELTGCSGFGEGFGAFVVVAEGVVVCAGVVDGDVAVVVGAV